MANWPATLLALAQNCLAQWFCAIAATVAVFLSESLGQNLIVITSWT
jgi:hypothetical protein